MRVGIAFTGAPHTFSEFVEHVRTAESKDFETVWFMEDYYWRDAFTSLSYLAARTTKIRLATGIINPYTRTAPLIAMSMASLHEISGKRAILGIGAGVSTVINQMTEYVGPMSKLRETVHIIRELWSGRNVTYQGARTYARDITLGVCPYFESFGRWDVRESTIPIYVAGVGPQMLQLAGAIGDGVLIGLGVSPRRLKRAIDLISEGARKANRSLNDIDIAVYVSLSPSQDGSVDQSTKSFAALCMTKIYDQQSLTEMYDIDEKTLQIMKLAFDKGGYQEAAKHVTKDMANEFGAAGKKEECIEILDRYTKAGAKMLIAAPLNRTNVDMAIETAHEYVQ